MKKALTPTERLRVAVAANVCERTVRRWASGQDVRPSLRERIERAVREMRGVAA